MLPEILLFGKAGSGKDTVADILCQEHGAVKFAMADPMKRLGAFLFGFTEDQLWGPSSSRNAIDPRYVLTEIDPHAGAHERWARNLAWETAIDRICEPRTRAWIAEVLDLDSTDRKSTIEPLDRLDIWFSTLLGIAGKAGGLTPRAMLQTLGTEWGRYIDEQMWVRAARRTQRKLLYGNYSYDRTQGLVAAPGQRYDLAVVTDGRFPNECLEFKAGGALVVRIRDPQGEAASAAALQAGVQGHASETLQETIPDSWFDVIVMNDKSLGMERLRKNVDLVHRSFYSPPVVFADERAVVRL